MKIGRLVVLMGLFTVFSAPSVAPLQPPLVKNKKVITRLAGVDDGPPAQLCDVIESGDKSGNWECLKGDGTMLSGSATTWTPTGSPTNSTEGSGYAVRTYTSVQNDKQPSNAAFPASSFSVCQHLRFPSSTGHVVLAFGDSGAGASTYTTLVEINAAHTSLIFYASNGTSATQFTQATTVSDNTWYLLCFVYSRVGGAANNTITVYSNGSSLGTRSTEALMQAQSSRWSSDGYHGGTNGAAKAIRGMFVTYKALSGADISRIYGAIQN